MLALSVKSLLVPAASGDKGIAALDAEVHMPFLYRNRTADVALPANLIGIWTSVVTRQVLTGTAIPAAAVQQDYLARDSESISITGTRVMSTFTECSTVHRSLRQVSTTHIKHNRAKHNTVCHNASHTRHTNASHRDAWQYIRRHINTATHCSMVSCSVA